MSLAAINVTGPLAKTLLQRAGLADPPRFLGHVHAEIAGIPCHVMRLSFTGEAAFELHHPVDRSVELWRALMDLGADLGIRPHGLQALFGLRLEKGHVIVGMDTELDTTPRRIGMDWAVRMEKPAFIGRAALERELRDKTSRWKMTGLVFDWRDYDRHFDNAGLIPPKDHTPIDDEYYIYDDDGKQLGYATSQMYSPMLQRHIALARVPLELTKPGSRVKMELAVNHRYEYFDAVVTRLPLYNPARRTA